MTEHWKQIEGYPDYEVSDMGRVRSKPRIADRGKWGKLEVRGRVLVASGTQYPRVNLRREGKGITREVHVLVCAAFIGPRPSGHQINHKNCDMKDNRLENLEYTTPLENTQHALRHGRWNHAGIKNANAKLTDSQVIAIKAELANGAKPAYLGGKYGVHPNYIYAIRSGRRWKHVGVSQQDTEVSG